MLKHHDAQMMRVKLILDVAAGEIEVYSVTSDHFRDAEHLIRRHAFTERLRTLDALQLADFVFWASWRGPYLLDFIGRGGGIRTHGPLRPRQVRYQAALRPDMCQSSSVYRTLFPCDHIY